MDSSGPPIAFPSTNNDAAAIRNNDIISQLPDGILISIVGLLCTKEAVRTRILSNRWWSLCKYVPNIELRCSWLVRPCPYPFRHDSNIFINEVDRILKARSGLKIRSLKLRCCYMKPCTERFEQTLCSPGRVGIERFFLNFSFVARNFTGYSFSCHLISEMPSLTVLALAWCYFLCPMPASLKLTPSNSSLQVMKFSAVRVSNGALECILSDCLSLHSVSCHLPSKLFIRGSNLQLNSLMMDGCLFVEEIELFAPNLVTFEYTRGRVVNFIFDHVPKLQNISLSLAYFDVNTISYVCTKLVKDLPQLKSLILFTNRHIYPEFSSRTLGFNIDLLMNIIGRTCI